MARNKRATTPSVHAAAVQARHLLVEPSRRLLGHKVIQRILSMRRWSLRGLQSRPQRAATVGGLSAGTRLQLTGPGAAESCVMVL